VKRRVYSPHADDNWTNLVFYFGVEPMDPIGGRHAQRLFDVSSDAIQKGLAILLGRLNEQFPIGVPAHILSEKINSSQEKAPVLVVAKIAPRGA
jgi:hypothetical protein